MSIIETKGLTHIYGEGTPFRHVAIENIDFTVEEGELHAVIGHTGSGKSTFIQHLNGLLKPTSGSVFVDGADIFASKEASRTARTKVGLVFQYPEYQLFEETVYKDIAFGPKNMKLSEGDIDERVRWAAELVGLAEDDLEKSPFDMSGGQKRRVAIAGVIAMKPRVLILDEPAAGLDPEGREYILNNIRQFKQKTDATVIMVTHDMDAAAKMADKITVLDHGKVCLSGTPLEVFINSETLTEIGLTVPRSTQIADRMRALGADIPKGIYTFDRLRDAVLRIRGGAGNA